MHRQEPFSWKLARIFLATAVFASSCVLPWLATQTPPTPTPSLQDDLPGPESVDPTAIPEDFVGPEIEYPKYEEEPYIPPPPSILDAAPKLPEKAQGEPVDLHLFATPGQIAYDGFVTFSAIVNNDSAEILNNLVFVDELETGFAFLPEVNQTVSFDVSTNTINFEITELAPGEQVAFNYTLQVTAPSSSAKGEVWVHIAEVNSKDAAVALKASAELWVGQPALQSNIEVARLDKDGGWAETQNASIYIEPNALQQDAIAVISPVAVASGPDMQFQVELYETENAVDGDYDGLAEQQLAVTDEVSDELAIPAFMEVEFDALGDLDNLPGGKEPFVTTYIPELDVWVKMPPTLVDYENNTVTVETDHFSTWGAGIGDSLPQNGANVLLFDQPYTSLFTGSARYSVPVWTPPGRGGMAPGVSLSYSSATVDGVLGDVQAPWVGVGWNMDAIEIVRQIDTDEDGYGYVDEYALTFNGALHELIQDENNPEKYYTKRGSFLYIERHNLLFENAGIVDNATHEWWEVVATDGTRYRLGWNTDSEQLALMYGYSCATGAPCTIPASPYDNLGYAGTAENLVAMRWRVDRITDTNGNYIDYNYSEVQPETSSDIPAFDLASYLASIEYTGHLTAQNGDPGYEIKFVSADRPTGYDQNPTDFGIWDHYDTRLLDRIEIYCKECDGLENQAVRTYDLDYGAPAAPNSNGTLTLDSITISGGNFTQNGQYVPGATAARVSFDYVNKDNRAVTGDDDPFTYPRLTSIDNGYGGVLTYDYEDDGRGTDSWYNYRVDDVTVNNGLGTAAIQGYTYADVQYTNVGGLNLGELIGYQNVTETTYDFNGSDEILKVHHNFGTITADTGRELWTEWRDPDNSDEVIRKVVNTYTTDNSQAPFDDFEYRYLSTVKNYELQNSSLVLTSMATYTRDPGNGNLIEQQQHLGSSLYRKYFYDYNINTDPDYYILDRVSRQRITNASNSTLADTRYYYDDLANPNDPPTAGNLLYVQALTGGSSNETVDVRYTLDSDGYGNTTDVYAFTDYGVAGTIKNTSANNNHSVTEFESTFHTYPTKVTNAADHEVSTKYIEMLGLPYEITDANSYITKTKYDGLGRVTDVYAPDFSQPTVSYTYPSLNGNGVVPAPYDIQMEILDDLGPNSPKMRFVWGIYDGLGRILQNQVRDDSDGRILVTDTAFNAQGLAEKQSVPHYESIISGNYLTPSWGSLDYTATVYDLLGRATQVTAPGNIQSQTAYDGLETTVTDPNGEKIMRAVDGLGRLIKVEEYDGATLYATTNYLYDTLDRLTRVVDAHNNVTDIDYDWLGRKTSMNDPDMGEWTYSYDSQGNLTQQTDARGQILLFSYDELNRLTFKYKDSIDAANELAEYIYDEYPVSSPTETEFGQRLFMDDDTGQTTWEFSNEGRTIEETRTFGADSYIF